MFVSIFFPIWGLHGLTIVISLCLCLCSQAWGDTDKTIVDLERGQPQAASRYNQPRGVQQYVYDETEVDLARPRRPAAEALSVSPTVPSSQDVVPPSEAGSQVEKPLPGSDR